MVVTGNQPQVRADIQVVFAESPGAADSRATAEPLHQGHGRLEQRRLTTRTALVGSSDWPGRQHVFQLERRALCPRTGQRREAVGSGSTRLAPAQGPPAMLLRSCCHQWHSEHKAHWVRAVTFDADRSQVRCGRSPQVLVALRNTAIGLLRAAGETNSAAACRRLGAQPWSALALIGIAAEN